MCIIHTCIRVKDRGSQIHATYICASYTHASRSMIIDMCIMNTCIMDISIMIHASRIHASWVHEYVNPGNMHKGYIHHGYPLWIQSSWIHASCVHTSWIHASWKHASWIHASSTIRITYTCIMDTIMDTSAQFTRPERPKGAKDEVKRPVGLPARSQGPEGPQTSIYYTCLPNTRLGQISAVCHRSSDSDC